MYDTASFSFVCAHAPETHGRDSHPSSSVAAQRRQSAAVGHCVRLAAAGAATATAPASSRALTSLQDFFDARLKRKTDAVTGRVSKYAAENNRLWMKDIQHQSANSLGARCRCCCLCAAPRSYCSRRSPRGTSRSQVPPRRSPVGISRPQLSNCIPHHHPRSRRHRQLYVLPLSRVAAACPAPRNTHIATQAHDRRRRVRAGSCMPQRHGGKVYERCIND